MTIGPEQVVAEDRREQRRNGVIWLAVALILAMLLGFAYRTDQRADKGDARLTNSNSSVESLKGQVAANGQIAKSAKAAAEEANRRLAAAGKPTVPVPTEAPVSPTVAPSAGVTEAQVRSIVTSAIQAYSPTLTPSQVEQIARVAAPKVVRPRDGRAPTTAELQPLVAVAVTSYCGEDRCVGKPGGKGEPGQDAPPVTDERLSELIDTSLKAYCAQHNGCIGADGSTGAKGDKGDKGDPGEKGDPGPDTSAAKCASMNGELQELTVTTTDPLTQAKILVCVLK